ncbi:hypothetical protein ACLOJK_018607 [Asimina triloba]
MATTRAKGKARGPKESAKHNAVLTNEHVLHMTRHNMFLTTSIERLITVVDGLSHRMDSFEKHLDDLCSEKASIHGVKGGKPSSD